MGKVLEAIALALGVPVAVLIALAFALVISLQCWLEHKLHGVDYNTCTCEKDPLGCDDYPYGK
jgi:hypothetical protein